VAAGSAFWVACWSDVRLMRRTLSFFMASALLLGGLALAAFEFLKASVMNGLIIGGSDGAP
jgi:hypothetical protein